MMNEKEELLSELSNLRARISELEASELMLNKTELELKAANQQLDVSNQQLSASEQQLRAINDQLEANEQELILKEASTSEAREYAENIISTVRVPLIILDGDLRVVSANQFFYNTFEVVSKETEGEFFYSLGNNQWNIPALKKLLNKILPEKLSVEDYEIEHHFEKIGNRTMLLNARELLQKKGKQRRILISIQDITVSRNAEKKLQSLNSELEAKTKDLQQFLYITTHDLRSPLVNIQGFNKELGVSLKELSDLLKSDNIPAPVKKQLKTLLEDEIPESLHFITSSTNKMDALLTGLLVLSRLGRQTLDIKQLDMNQLMNDVVDNFEYEIMNKNVVLKVSDLPDCQGDARQMNQLFSNLLGNALKFLDPERSGIIHITGEKVDGFIRYEVQDNGIGIHPDHQEKVFELFHKLDPKKPGIGLGMNIVKQIAEKHNGKIELESEVSIGTKYSIFVPY
jgi:signal transduction histidine kinase